MVFWGHIANRTANNLIYVARYLGSIQEMDQRFERERLLIGQENLSRLAGSRVLLFGVGGVGGYTAECLARAGIGHLTIVDADKVDITNINRQIIALHSTVGKYKTEVMAERIKDINPDAEVTVKNCFFLPENADEFNFYGYDYIADCVDTVAAKLEIITRAKACGTPVISAMGAGGKLDPSLFRVSDISKTEYCPLAKVMRRELRKRGITHVPVVWSPEVHPRKNVPDDTPIGTVSFVPAAAGLVLAGEIIRTLAGTVPEI